MKLPATLIRGKFTFAILSILFLFQFHAFSQIDLEISISTANINPAQYSNISVETVITNNSGATATEVVVEIPISNLSQIVYSGGNEFTASQGSFYPYGTEIWEVGDLAPGASATMTTNYFVLEETSYPIYTQVLHANESDLDSSPNNGTPPTANEDDEAALLFNDSGNCSISASISNIVCDNSGTSNDPNDDLFTFDLTINGTNTSGNWVVEIPSPSGPNQFLNGQFGETIALTYNINAVNIDLGGVVNILIEDSNDSSCSTDISVNPPATCSSSNTCQITGELISVDCSNGGTPNDPDDDTWGYIINVSGTNQSNNWILDFPGGFFTGLYDQHFSFPNLPLTGPETRIIEIRDQADVNCTTTITVNAPFPCNPSGNLADMELTVNSTSTGGAFVFVSFEITATNNGNADANGVHIFVPIPDDVVLQGGNEFSATAGGVFGINNVGWFLEPMAPGQTEVLTINYFTFTDVPTTCYAQVMTMIGDDLDSTPANGTPPIPNEDDEAAFTIGGVPNLPDLTVSNLTHNLPSVLELETDYPIAFDLNNIGNTLAAGDFRIGMYLSLDENFDANSDILIGQVLTGNIAQTTPINALVQVENTTPSQDYFILIVADDLEEIQELDESNNMLSSGNTFSVFNQNDICTGFFQATSQAELNLFPQSCTTWAGSIELNGNITDLSPLANLDIILGNLIFETCDVTDFSPISGLQEAGTLFFYFNPNMTNLNGLPVNIITQSIQVIGNANMTSLDGMPTITSELNNLTIANNANLQSLDGLSGITGNHPDMVLVVDLNPQLTSLSGLDNITEVNILSIATNENLTECCPVFELLNTNAFNNANLFNNDSGCNSVQDVLDTCNPNQCQITVTVLDIQCQNQSTLDDDSDDTFNARILVEGSNNCQGNFLIDGIFGGLFGGNGIFGEQATLGYYPISGGDVSIEVTDVNGNNGVQVILEAPQACSNGANPNECGFENTYPPIPNIINLFYQNVEEISGKYELEIFQSSPATHYDLSVDLEGTELSNTSIGLPTGILRKASDGNFFSTSNVSTTEQIIAKTDGLGTVIWSNTFTFDTGNPQSPPQVRDVIELSDGQAFLVMTNGPTDNSWILKTDNSGNEIYLKHLQETDGFLEYKFQGLAQNGDFLAYRHSSPRVGHLLRISPDGDLIYEESIIGDLVTSRFGGFAETPDGNFIYASYRNQLTPELEKLDAFTGNTIWRVNLSNTFSPDNDIIYSGKGDVVATSDGGAVVGYPFSEVSGGNTGYEYGRVNDFGLLVWWHHLPEGYDLDAELETSDGGFLFAGDINGTLGIVKTTSEGLLTPNCIPNPINADLSLSLNTTPTIISSGAVVHTLTITNEGQDDATNVTVQFYEGNSFIQTALSVTAGNYDNQTGLWNVGAVAAGNSETLVLEEFFVDFEFSPTSSISFFEVLTSNENDQDSTPGNDNGDKTDDEDDEVIIEIFPNGSILPYDLSVVLETQQNTVNVGETVIFDFVVKSDQNYAIDGIIAQLDIPASLQIDNFTVNQGNFDSNTGQWDVGYLLPLQSATLSIEATLLDDSQVTNVFGQIQVTNNLLFDFDSEPGNGFCCLPLEDDEAVLKIQTDGSISKPDLFINNIVLDINPLGTELDISFNVNNIGPVPVNNHSSTRLLLSDDQFLSPDDQLLGLNFLLNQPIIQGSFFSFPTSNIPLPNLAPGDYSLIVFTDYEDSVIEANENNNLTIIPFNIPDLVSGVDLELQMTTSNPNPAPFSFFEVTLDLSNTGNEIASNIIVDFPLPNELTYQGGNEYTASQGTYAPYGNQQWNAGSLNPGESATLAINYFVLGNNSTVHIYAQIIAQAQIDQDSEPNNGTPPTVNEDDEAVISFQISSPSALIAPEVFEFQAFKSGDFTTELFWLHNKGKNVETYTLEYSENGIDFEQKSSQISSGKNTFNTYRDYDAEPKTGDNIYRIKMLQTDGTIEYSNTQTVHFDDLIDFTLFPNPANKMVKLNLETIVARKNVRIEIYNNLGILVGEKDIPEVINPYNQLDLRDLPEGIYTVYLKVPNRKAIAKRLMIGRI